MSLAEIQMQIKSNWEAHHAKEHALEAEVKRLEGIIRIIRAKKLDLNMDAALLKLKSPVEWLLLRWLACDRQVVSAWRGKGDRYWLQVLFVLIKIRLMIQLGEVVVDDGITK